MKKAKEKKCASQQEKKIHPPEKQTLQTVYS